MSRIYLALGDSMSIDHYTGVVGGGAVNQFYRSLPPGWELVDRSVDGCTIARVPRSLRGELITLTIGGNDLVNRSSEFVRDGVDDFRRTHRALLDALRSCNPDAVLLVANIYAPQFTLTAGMRKGLDDANEAIASSVEEARGRLIDVHHAFRGHESEYLCREIEPSFQGATVIAELFRAAWAQAKPPE